MLCLTRSPGSDAITAAEAHVPASTYLDIPGRFVGLPVQVLSSFAHVLGFCLDGFCLCVRGASPLGQLLRLVAQLVSLVMQGCSDAGSVGLLFGCWLFCIRLWHHRLQKGSLGAPPEARCDQTCRAAPLHP